MKYLNQNLYSIYNVNNVEEFLDIFHKDNPFVLRSDMEDSYILY